MEASVGGIDDDKLESCSVMTVTVLSVLVLVVGVAVVNGGHGIDAEEKIFFLHVLALIGKIPICRLL